MTGSYASVFCPGKAEPRPLNSISQPLLSRQATETDHRIYRCRGGLRVSEEGPDWDEELFAPQTIAYLRTALLEHHRFHQIPRSVDVQPFLDRHVICEQLQGHDLKNR